MRLTTLSCALTLVAPLLAQVGLPDGSMPVTPVPAGSAPPQPMAAPLATWIVPSAYATQMGNWNNRYPYGEPGMRYQQVFLGSELTQSAVWRGLALRQTNTTGGRPGGPVRLSILLGRTSYDHNTLTASFAGNANVGPMDTVADAVHYNLPDLFGFNVNPAQLDVVFPFTKPHVYTPTAGQNVLVEIVNTSHTPPVWSFLDAVDSTAAGRTTSRMYAFTPTAATGGGPYANGLIMAFLDQVRSQAYYGPFGAGCPGTGGTAGVIVPANMRGAMGNSENIYGHSFENQRYQQVFLGSEMGTARLLTGHAFRVDERNTAVGGPITIEVLMGTTTYDHTNLTTSFATNATGTQTIVLPRMQVNTPALPVNVNPRDFSVRIPWRTPWAWTPGPNLLFECQNHDPTRVVSQWFDANGGSTTARIWATPVTSTLATGSSLGYGLVVQFLYSGQPSSPPLLGNLRRPVLGSTMAVHLWDARPSSAAVLVLGVSDRTWGPFNLPLDLTGLGAPQCSLLVSFDLIAATVATDAKGSGSLLLPIPGDLALDGVTWFNQWLVVDRGVNALGLVVSNGAQARAGQL